MSDDKMSEEMPSINIDHFEIDLMTERSEFRCVNCFRIPMIKIVKEEEIPNIEYSCECTLSEKQKSKVISIKDFLDNFTQIQLKTMICNMCNHGIGSNNIINMYFCFTCKKPYCDKCITIHKNEKPGHENLDINSIDDHCLLHPNEQIVAWSINFKINLCNFCCADYRDFETIKINDEIIQEETLNNYKKDINTISTYIFTKMKMIQNNMINKCNDQIEKNEIIKLYQENFNINQNLFFLALHSINTYQLYKDKLIYPIIQNIKNSCNFNLGKIGFNQNDSINDYKNYLKTVFITNYSKNESLIQFNKDEMDQLIQKFLNETLKIGKEEETINETKLYENYVPIINDEIPTPTNIGKLKCIKSINVSKKNKISALIILHNKRFAIGKGKNIDIIDENELQILITLQGHDSNIVTLSQLKDDTHRLISGDFNNNIKLWLFNDTTYQCVGNIKDKENNFNILKLIHLSTDKLVCLTSQSIEIFEKDFPFEKNLLFISDKEKDFISLLETKKNLLISSSPKGSLRLYNQKDLTVIKELNNIYCTSMDALIEVKNDRIAIGGNKQIYVVNSNNFKLEKICITEDIVTSLSLLYDNTLLVCELDKSLKQYDFDSCALLGTIENAHYSFSISCVQINQKYIVNASFVGYNIWEYE